jgi:hypothetical protein
MRQQYIPEETPPAPDGDPTSCHMVTQGPPLSPMFNCARSSAVLWLMTPHKTAAFRQSRSPFEVRFSTHRHGESQLRGGRLFLTHHY